MTKTRISSNSFINPDQFSTYLIVLLLYPIFFLLHGVNENFGLVPFNKVAKLGLSYLLITAGVALLSKWIFLDNRKALIYSFAVLSLCFFFGPLKDAADGVYLFETITRYKYLLPLLLLVFLALLIYLRKTRNTFTRLT